MNPSVHLAVSGVSNGSMSKAVSDEARRYSQQQFLTAQAINVSRTVLVRLEYEGSGYCRYSAVNARHAGDGIVSGSTIIADALFTREKDLALLLPVADCVAAVLFDAVQGILGLAHLGRHNLLQSGAQKTIEYMRDEFGSRPNDIQIWLSPAAGEKNYPLFDFDNRGLIDVTTEQLIAAGVTRDAISIDSRDTTTDPELFSHSQFLKGNRNTDGRQAVVAVMRPWGDSLISLVY